MADDRVGPFDVNVHVVRGEIDVNNIRLGAGDGAKIAAEAALAFAAHADSMFLLFDVTES